MAQQALESNAKLKRDDSRNISAYFNKVDIQCPLAVKKLFLSNLLLLTTSEQALDNTLGKQAHEAMS